MQPLLLFKSNEKVLIHQFKLLKPINLRFVCWLM